MSSLYTKLKTSAKFLKKSKKKLTNTWRKEHKRWRMSGCEFGTRMHPRSSQTIASTRSRRMWTGTNLMDQWVMSMWWLSSSHPPRTTFWFERPKICECNRQLILGSQLTCMITKGWMTQPLDGSTGDTCQKSDKNQLQPLLRNWESMKLVKLSIRTCQFSETGNKMTKKL